MSVIEEIVSWAHSQPGWQRDALRRLVEKGTLTSEDDDELLGMLKTSRGIDGGDQAPQPKPIVADDIPHPACYDRNVVLTSMFQLTEVNALAPDQALEFLPTGITVVYGDNAAGKSGYSRVLKRACRARDRAESVLPNVFSSHSGTRCSASFLLEVDGREETLRWTDDSPSPEALSSIAVFDSRCARLYVDNEDRIVYQPYGLDILPQLVNLCARLRSRLESEINTFAPIVSELRDLPSDTAAGRVANNPTIASVQSIPDFSEKDVARRDELKVLVAKLKAENSRVRIAELTRRQRRMAKVQAEALRIDEATNDKKVARLRVLCTERDVLKELREKSTSALSGEPLPGVGSDVWRRLYLAALEYSEEKAYPDVPFPNVTDGSVCVLCQQSLDPEARDRLARFSAFVSSKTETQMAEVEAGIGQELEALTRQSFDSSGGDPTALEELAELDATLASQVQTHAKGSQARATALAAAVQDGSWDAVPPAPSSPAAHLEALAGRLATELKALEAAAEPAEAAALEKELTELDARAALLRHRDNLIARLRLEECLKEVKTTGISRKQSELADTAVTDVLREALQREITNLGFTKLTFTIATRTRDGQSYSQLELSEPMGRRVQLSGVLSEGEQTVVAIASFLAELHVGSHTCGVVFDDPVCSLDHLWRDRIAKRLAEEGRDRQVIVFTHDVAFVLALQRHALKVSTGFSAQSLHCDGDRAGICEAGLPEIALSVKDRITYLKRLQALAKECSGDADLYRERMRDCYRVLRAAWERLVEEVLLAGTVIRYGHGVQTQLLAEVQVDDEDYERVFNAMELCSERFEGHDRGADRGDAVCTPDEMLADIEELDSFRKDLERRKQATGSRRRARTRMTAPT